MLLRQWPSTRSLEHSGEKDVSAAFLLFHDPVPMTLVCVDSKRLSAATVGNAVHVGLGCMVNGD